MKKEIEDILSEYVESIYDEDISSENISKKEKIALLFFPVIYMISMFISNENIRFSLLLLLLLLSVYLVYKTFCYMLEFLPLNPRKITLSVIKTPPKDEERKRQFISKLSQQQKSNLKEATIQLKRRYEVDKTLSVFLTGKVRFGFVPIMIGSPLYGLIGGDTKEIILSSSVLMIVEILGFLSKAPLEVSGNCITLLECALEEKENLVQE